MVAWHATKSERKILNCPPNIARAVLRYTESDIDKCHDGIGIWWVRMTFKLTVPINS
jgi:hypothetical protein